MARVTDVMAAEEAAHTQELLRTAAEEGQWLEKELEEMAEARSEARWFPESASWQGLIVPFYVFAFFFDLVTFFVLLPALYPRGPVIQNRDGWFGWHLLHLTVWCGVAQTVYFAVACADTLQRHVPHYRRVVHPHRDRFFTLVFTMSTIVALGFFLVVFPDPRTRAGHAAADYYMDVAGHGATGLFIWIEGLLVRHRYSDWREALIPVFFALAYLAWISLCHLVDRSIWPYDFLADLTPAERFLCFAAFLALVFVFYFVSRELLRRLWKDR
jgi:hypothetical protein